MINRIMDFLISSYLRDQQEEKPLFYEKESRKIIYFDLILFLFSFIIRTFGLSIFVLKGRIDKSQNTEFIA